MSISLTSARRLTASAVGATAIAGAMLFGATPAANAAPAYIPAVVGPDYIVVVYMVERELHNVTLKAVVARQGGKSRSPAVRAMLAG